MVNSTDAKIRAAAFKLFLERGYEATNIRDICKNVDIKAASLYFYYSTKQELFFSIYDEISSDNVDELNRIVKLMKESPPHMKLFYIYKKTMDYYAKDILKQKFLLRYHLFPPEEHVIAIKDRFKHWSNKEDEIIISIIDQCLEAKILPNDRLPGSYLQDYKKFLNKQAIETIIFNIRLSEEELDRSWFRFWDCELLSSPC